MSEAKDRLLRIAHKRTQAPRSCLTDEIRSRLGEIRLDRWVVPEDMSLGYYTPFWEELSEEERRDFVKAQVLMMEQGFAQ